MRVYDDKLWLWNAGGLPEGITIDKLKKPHSSCLRNELLADVFFKAGFIEAWGRGTLKIVNKCKEKGLPEPEFSEMTGGLLVSFIKEKSSAKATKEVAEKVIEQVRRRFGEKFGESSEKIIGIILKDNNAKAREIAKQMGISQRAVEKQIAKLKKTGILERIGPAKGGYWRLNI